MPSAATSAASERSCLRRSGAIGSQAVVGGELHGERQRLVRFALRQRDAVDDHEFGRRFQLVNQLADVLVLALEDDARLHPSVALILERGLVLLGVALL